MNSGQGRPLSLNHVIKKLLTYFDYHFCFREIFLGFENLVVFKDVPILFLKKSLHTSYILSYPIGQ